MKVEEEEGGEGRGGQGLMRVGRPKVGLKLNVVRD